MYTGRFRKNIPITNDNDIVADCDFNTYLNHNPE